MILDWTTGASGVAVQVECSAPTGTLTVGIQTGDGERGPPTRPAGSHLEQPLTREWDGYGEPGAPRRDDANRDAGVATGSKIVDDGCQFASGTCANRLSQ